MQNNVTPLAERTKPSVAEWNNCWSIIRALVAAIVLISPAVSSFAQSPAKEKSAPAADAKASQQAVEQAVKQYIAAVNSRDFKRAAAFWAEDGQYLHAAGDAVKAAPLVERELTGHFVGADKPRLTINGGPIRMVNADTATETGEYVVAAGGGTSASGGQAAAGKAAGANAAEGGAAGSGARTTRGRYSSVWMRQGGKWLIHSVQELNLTPRSRTQSLAELGWLVGSWAVDKESNAVVHIDCEWTPSKAFLLRKITVEKDGALQRSLRQRIGIDPVNGKIKSWSFGAHGGLTESYWTKSEKHWVVRTRGYTPDGTETSADTIYSDISDDGFTLESIHSRIGAKKLEPATLRFTRQAADNQAQAVGGLIAATSAKNTTGSKDPARDKILNSRAWREAQFSFFEWLSGQDLYTPQEAKQIQAQFTAKVAKLSAAELPAFLEDLQAKVAVLVSQPAEDARLWLAERMSVEVKPSQQEIKETWPDVVNLTAAQVEQRLLELQQQRAQIKSTQKAFAKGTQERVKVIEQQEKEAEKEREQALNRAYSSMESSSSGYGPVSNNPGLYGGGIGGFGDANRLFGDAVGDVY